jgi:hypothetical protein
MAHEQPTTVEATGPFGADEFARARTFLWSNARLLDRRLFQCLFAGGAPEEVVTALRAYQNADGGFGNALEPDVRAPVSQPVPVELAFRALDAVAGFELGRELVVRACDYLMTITTAEGGVPSALPSIRDYPHAPWWEAPDAPPASLNPTAALAGLLHKRGIQHAWLDGATQYCWEAIAASETTEYHDLMPVLTFLEHAPDRARAEHELARVTERIRQPGVVTYETDAEGYVKGPLDWAPRPTSPCRRLFSDEVIVTHLAALAARQRPDGGWPISWPPLSPACEAEWRGWVTIEALLTLRAYGALDTASTEASRS